MSESAYELLALAARYWFVFLMLLVVLHGWRSCVTANRRSKLLRSMTGDASCVGELLVVRAQGHARLLDKRFAVPAEGVLGRARVADVRINHRAIERRHLWLRYTDGYLTLRPLGKAGFSAPRTPDGRFILCDGDQLEIGPLTFMLVLYDPQEAVQAEDAQIKQPPAQSKKPAPQPDDDDEFWG